MFICSICNLEKEDAERVHGRRRCRICYTAYLREYRTKNKEQLTVKDRARYPERRERLLAKMRNKWANEPEYRARDKARKSDPEYKKIANARKREKYTANPTKVLERNKIYRVDHRNELLEYNRQYYKNHKEKFALDFAEYYQNNKEREKSRKKQYRKDNPEKFLKAHRDYTRQRRIVDLNFKLRTNLRTRLYIAIKNNQKVGSAIKDLGCTVPELKLYLEVRFQPGMSWYNYGNKDGQWSIDHIMPLSIFDLTNREEFLKVCHYTNLQPMWHKNNIKKSNKIL